MTPNDPARYRDLAEAAWRWVLDQVRWADGPWVPFSVAVEGGVDGGADGSTPNQYRDGIHEGIGGLAYVLAELQLSRPWTDEETDVSLAVAQRVRSQTPTATDVSFFDGLTSTLGILVALDATGADHAVRRLLDTCLDDGWPKASPSPERYLPEIRYTDATVGTASVLLGAVWGMRNGVAGARELAERTASILLAEAEPVSTGLSWRYVPLRFLKVARPEMPNWSHGLAGVAATLALAGVELGRPDLLHAARLGAEHLVTLADRCGGGFVVPISSLAVDPALAEPVSYGWCHGPTGTSLLFLALHRAGVSEVAGQPTTSWYARGRHSVRTSGLPDRQRPGFWDNDGRCCGTAGVGDAFLDAYARAGDDADLALAVELADALVERAVETNGHAYWRFVEHRNAEPLLPPGVGWMQGAAGIAAYLFRLARVLDTGRNVPAVRRMENWWAVDPGSSRSSGE
ncbi:MAG: lanthionine synthetase LanC family protein [Lapillicoccus sp.]